jgi:hypothetical protein
MTPIAGLIIAIIAGLIVRNGRRATAVLIVPWLVVLAYQSWYIASGRAISPPGTVTDFPSAIGYWLVQAVILLPALGIAAQLGASGSSRQPRGSDSLARRAGIATALGLATAVIVILLGFVWFRQQGGTVFAGHHSSEGSPPLSGTDRVLPHLRRPRRDDAAAAARGQGRAAGRAGAAGNGSRRQPGVTDRVRVHNVSTVRGGWR